MGDESFLLVHFLVGIFTKENIFCFVSDIHGILEIRPSSELVSDVVQTDFRPPFRVLFVPAHATDGRCVVRADGLVAVIFALRADAQVGLSIVERVSVDMVDDGVLLHLDSKDRIRDASRTATLLDLAADDIAFLVPIPFAVADFLYILRVDDELAVLLTVHIVSVEHGNITMDFIVIEVAMRSRILIQELAELLQLPLVLITQDISLQLFLLEDFSSADFAFVHFSKPPTISSHGAQPPALCDALPAFRQYGATLIAPSLYTFHYTMAWHDISEILSLAGKKFPTPACAVHVVRWLIRLCRSMIEPTAGRQSLEFCLRSDFRESIDRLSHPIVIAVGDVISVCDAMHFAEAFLQRLGELVRPRFHRCAVHGVVDVLCFLPSLALVIQGLHDFEAESLTFCAVRVGFSRHVLDAFVKPCIAEGAGGISAIEELVNLLAVLQSCKRPVLPKNWCFIGKRTFQMIDSCKMRLMAKLCTFVEDFPKVIHVSLGRKGDINEIQRDNA